MYPIPALRHGPDNPFMGRCSGTPSSQSTSNAPSQPRCMRFFRATTPPPTRRRDQPLPPGWRRSSNGYILRPGEVDFFEEEAKEEEQRKALRERRLIRLARERERAARARSEPERQRLLNEHYPLIPYEGTQYWESGLSPTERQARLERWRQRYFHVAVRFRCDPRIYDRYRQYYLPTEGLLDPLNDRDELEKMRRDLFTSLPRRSNFLSRPTHDTCVAMPRKGWVVGHKREFIERHQDAFRKAPKKAVVYRAVARGLLCRAGDDPFSFDLKKEPWS
ncbi:hypothetical protein K523DRAFT_359094 [Schizophyllum commune Tattone D]|nr:hypothetical protein K523DRAFT_359094 [Schizophyllum commune Tattone D]